MNSRVLINDRYTALDAINNELKLAFQKTTNSNSLLNIINRLGESLLSFNDISLKDVQGLDADLKNRMVAVIISLQFHLDHTTTLSRQVRQISQQLSCLMTPFLVSSGDEHNSSGINHSIDLQLPIKLKAAIFSHIDNIDHNGVFHQEMIQCLKQEVPFITSRSLMAGINIQQTESLLQSRVALDDELLNHTESWCFYELKQEYGGEFLVFIPKSLLGTGPEGVQLRSLDFNADKLHRISLLEVFSKQPGTLHFDGLCHLFVENPQIAKLFYFAGHGGNNIISGLAADNYKKFLALMERQHCQGLTISSCASSGVSSLLTFSLHKVQPTNPSNPKYPVSFPICMRSIGDFPTFKQSSELNFKEYFDLIEKNIRTKAFQTLANWRKVIQTTEKTKEKIWQNYAKIYLPQSLRLPQGFRPIGEHNTGYSLTSLAAGKARLIPHDFKLTEEDLKNNSLTSLVSKAFKANAKKGSIELQNYKFIYLHPIEVKSTLVFKENDPLLISMIPGDSFHVIHSVRLADLTPAEYICFNKDLHRQGDLKATKAYFIHEIVGKTDVYSQVILFITPEMCFFAFKEKEAYYYYNWGKSIKKISPFLYDLFKLTVHSLLKISPDSVLAATAGFGSVSKSKKHLFYSLGPAGSDFRHLILSLANDPKTIGMPSFQTFFSKHSLKPQDKQIVVSIIMKHGYNDLALEIFKQENMDVNFQDFLGISVLRQALENNHLPFVQYLVENKVDMDAKDRIGSSLLFIAMENKNLDLLKILLAQPTIDLKAKTPAGNTPIVYSVFQGYKEAYDLLCEKGAKDLIYAESTDGATPLAKAARAENLKAVDFLLNEKADPNAGSPSPLVCAVRMNNLALAKKLLLAGGNPCLKDKAGDVPLVEAILRAAPEMVKLLLDHNTDSLNVTDRAGLSPFEAALYIGNREKIKMLAHRITKQDSFKLPENSRWVDKFFKRIEVSSDWEALKQIMLCFPDGLWELELYMVRHFLSSCNFNPELIHDWIQSQSLHLNICHPFHRSLSIRRKIFQSIFNAYQENETLHFQGKELIRTCLNTARESEHFLKDCKILIDTIIRQELEDSLKIQWLKFVLEEIHDFSKLPSHEELFNNIISCEDLDIVKLAVSKGASVHGTPKIERPLQAAIGNRTLFTWLVEQGANVNAIGGEKSAFTDAIESQNEELINSCLLHGAILNPENENQVMPLQAAARVVFQDEGKLFIRLVEAGAKINCSGDGFYNSPLAAIISSGNIELVKWCLSKGADVNHRPKKGFTPLQAAAECLDQYPEIFDVLIKAGADINNPGNNGCPPLLTFIEKNKYELTHSWLKQGASISGIEIKAFKAAVASKNVEMLKLILQHPFSQPISRLTQDAKKYLKIIWEDVIEANMLDFVHVLLKHQVNPIISANDTDTLYYIIRYNRLELLLILKRGSNQDTNPARTP